ncbi:aminoglycoside phosphotransferase [Gloeothece citriformis PCC 7424]|uniref:Aminoglycoside phosphotransferase n=1 Tax=Gloeothece citriformis (strain PCC 7424) TaxID=65393 RepID=B7KIN9_GLOC7|nr:phosphotransferase [Gloeothece citriformis]ACK69445.1 aminoglycoside phosphotransferase [Gloeothece citriformis PCC 7424]
MKLMLQPIFQKAKDQACLTTQQTEVFPVLSSLLAPEALSNLVLCHYDIDIPTSCHFWHRGLSDIYVLETLSNLYILRISHHHWRSKIEIDFELELLDYLYQCKIPVSAPLKTKDGYLSLEINAPEGKRYAVLFPYAPGQIALGDFNCTQSYLLGQTLAKLHQTSTHFSPLAYRNPLTPDYLLERSSDTIAPFLHHRHEDLQFLIKTIQEIKQQLNLLPTHAPYWGICWGDPHSGNVHFTSDNQMTLFDFDQCGYGWRAFDIAKFLQVSLQTGLSRKVRDAFIDGYQSCELLSAVELETLQALTQTAYIWSWAISLNSAKHYDYSRLDRYYFSQRLERLKRLKSKDWQLF